MRMLALLTFVLPLFLSSLGSANEGESSLPIAPRRYDEWDSLPTTVFSAVNGVDPAEGKWAPTGAPVAAPAQAGNSKPVGTVKPGGKTVTQTPGAANKLDKRSPATLKSQKPAVGSAKPGVGKAKTSPGKPATRRPAPAAAAKKKSKK